MAGEIRRDGVIPEEGAIAYLPIRDLRRAFEKGNLHPRGLVEAQLSRIDTYNPQINAIVAVERQKALDAADVAANRYGMGRARPLEGITVAVKDTHHFAGRVTTAGSLIHDGQVDSESAPIVQRLLAAGAIPLGRSTAPEFAMSASTMSLRHGVTRNPWDPDYSPGGSSGGAAASVAAGFVTIADGTDHGGSIRTPSACCGVYGHKPSWGRVPLPASEAFDTCRHYGLITRHIDDLAYAFDTIANPPSYGDRCSPSKDLPRVGFCLDLGFFRVDGAIERHMEVLWHRLEKAGFELASEEMVLPSAALKAYENYCLQLIENDLGHLHGNYSLSAYVRGYLDRAKGLSSNGDHVNALQQASAEITSMINSAFDYCDVLMLPVTTCVGVDPTFSIVNPDLGRGRGVVHWEEEWQMTWPFNMASEFPVIAVPTGFDQETGLPLGVQMVGRKGDDIGLMWSAKAMLAAIRT